MATAKSPFLVVQDFLSPKACESIVNDLGFYSPDIDKDGKPMKMFRHNETGQQIIYDRFKSHIATIEQYYKVEHRGTEDMIFEYFAQGTVSEPLCENSNYLRKKWVRTKDRDFTGVLFLSDYNEHTPFDGDYEVYGGKLEFPQHGFGFNPTRGVLIVYPSGPHFINANAAIIAGDLYQVRIHLGASLPYLYNPHEFPGDYRSWFKGL